MKGDQINILRMERISVFLSLGMIRFEAISKVSFERQPFFEIFDFIKFISNLKFPNAPF